MRLDERYIANKLCDRFVKKNIISHCDSDIYIYAFEVSFSEIINIVGIIIIAILLENIQYAMIFFISFIPQRCYMGGFHASSHFKCHLISFAAFVGCRGFSGMTLDSKLFRVVTVLVILMISVLLAPVEANNRILSRKHYYRNKKKLIVLALLDLAIVLFDILPYNHLSEFYYITKWCLIIFAVIPFLQTLVKSICEKYKITYGEEVLK